MAEIIRAVVLLFTESVFGSHISQQLDIFETVKQAWIQKKS